MTITYELKEYELTDDFYKTLKAAASGKIITITIEEVRDETDYLLSNESNRKHLLEAIEADKNRGSSHVLTIEQMEGMVEGTAE